MSHDQWLELVASLIFQLNKRPGYFCERAFSLIESARGGRTVCGFSRPLSETTTSFTLPTQPRRLTLAAGGAPLLPAMDVERPRAQPPPPHGSAPSAPPQLLDLPDDLLRLIARLCDGRDCRPVPLFRTCRRLSTIGYGSIHTLEVMAGDMGFVTSHVDRSVTARQLVPVAKTKALCGRDVRSCLSRARALRHLTLLDRSLPLTHGGWGEMASLEHPLFLRLAGLLVGLPLANLHCSGGAVHALPRRSAVGAGTLRKLELTDLSVKDDAQNAIVRAMLAAHRGILTDLRLETLWNTRELSPGDGPLVVCPAAGLAARCRWHAGPAPPDVGLSRGSYVGHRRCGAVPGP